MIKKNPQNYPNISSNPVSSTISSVTLNKLFNLYIPVSLSVNWGQLQYKIVLKIEEGKP